MMPQEEKAVATGRREEVERRYTSDAAGQVYRDGNLYLQLALSVPSRDRKPEAAFVAAALEGIAALSPPRTEAPGEVERLYGVLRWLYVNGVKPDYERPQEISNAFNEAFASHRIAQPEFPAPRSKLHGPSGDGGPA